jgi:hypothetical protein
MERLEARAPVSAAFTFAPPRSSHRAGQLTRRSSSSGGRLEEIRYTLGVGLELGAAGRPHPTRAVVGPRRELRSRAAQLPVAGVGRLRHARDDPLRPAPRRPTRATGRRVLRVTPGVRLVTASRARLDLAWLRVRSAFWPASAGGVTWPSRWRLGVSCTARSRMVPGRKRVLAGVRWSRHLAQRALDPRWPHARELVCLWRSAGDSDHGAAEVRSKLASKNATVARALLAEVLKVSDEAWASLTHAR